MGDDCNRVAQDSPVALEEFNGLSSAPAGCNYTVTYRFKALFRASAVADTGDVSDCDDGSALSESKFTNDQDPNQAWVRVQVSAASTNGTYHEHSAGGTR